MTVKELEQRIEDLDTQVARATRGSDDKLLIGAVAQGLFEIARQLAVLNSKHGEK